MDGSADRAVVRIAVDAEQMLEDVGTGQNRQGENGKRENGCRDRPTTPGWLRRGSIVPSQGSEVA